MIFRGMPSSRRTIWLGIALWSMTSQAEDPLFQSLCSTQNTGSDYAVVNDIWQSNGACHDQCLYNGNYAYAIVQWQNCWCSNYAPADQTSVETDCAASCPGFPSELCGNQDTGYYGYIALSAQPSGTIGAGGASTSTSESSAESSSTEELETSDVSGPLIQTVTQPPSLSIVTSIVTPTSSSTPKPPPKTTPAPPVVPVTSTIIQTINNQIVTQTVTSTPLIVPNSRPDTVEIRRKDGLSPGTVAGIVVGVVGGLIVLALAAFLLWRRRRNSEQDNQPDGSVTGSKKSMKRNVSVLSKAGLLRTRGLSMSEREHDDNYHVTPATGNNSVRHSMMFGVGDAIDPTSPLDSSHSSGSRRPSKPMVYDQRLNPSALFANQEANGSRISMQDQQDYSRPLGVMNPDPRPSFESRLSHVQ